MAKFCGNIGFVISKETQPGIWTDEVIEKQYLGDLLRRSYTIQGGTGNNDNLNIANQLSIVADTFANDNFQYMRYVTFKGQRWKINDADTMQYPRLILTIGGIYNGETAEKVCS